MEISQNIINFFEKQGFIILSTLDPHGKIHSVAKGIVSVDKKGCVYIIDLFKGTTYKNLRRDPTVSITAVDEHAYAGYTLQGKGKITDKKKIPQNIIKQWEDKVLQRITKRMLHHIQQERKSSHHHEAHFRSPEYLITMQVEDSIDLNPTHSSKDKK